MLIRTFRCKAEKVRVERFHEAILQMQYYGRMVHRIIIERLDIPDVPYTQFIRFVGFRLKPKC